MRQLQGDVFWLAAGCPGVVEFMPSVCVCCSTRQCCCLLLLLTLQVIEGMGRAIHTNLRTRFKCDTLKLAMIKTERLAVKLFGGSLYDCMCSFQRGCVTDTSAGGGGGGGGSTVRQ